MKTSAILFSFLIGVLSISLHAKPITLKNTKGAEIKATILSFDDDTVTFKRLNGKEYTQPWSAFDEDTIKRIKSTPLPNPHNDREEKKLALELADGETKNITIPRGEYLNDKGVLDLYPGETVHLEFQEIDGKLINPKVVPESKNPERTVTFSLKQTPAVTIFRRSTGIRKAVVVDCALRDFSKGDELTPINLYPNEKARLATSSWAGTVWSLQISNIEVSDKPAAVIHKERTQK